MQKKLYKKRDFYKKLASLVIMFLLGATVATIFSAKLAFVIGLTVFIFAFMIFDDLDYTVRNK